VAPAVASPGARRPRRVFRHGRHGRAPGARARRRGGPGRLSGENATEQQGEFCWGPRLGPPAAALRAAAGGHEGLWGHGGAWSWVLGQAQALAARGAGPGQGRSRPEAGAPPEPRRATGPGLGIGAALRPQGRGFVGASLGKSGGQVARAGHRVGAKCLARRGGQAGGRPRPARASSGGSKQYKWAGAAPGRHLRRRSGGQAPARARPHRVGGPWGNAGSHRLVGR
jgi:hypothetical protein